MSQRLLVMLPIVAVLTGLGGVATANADDNVATNESATQVSCTTYQEETWGINCDGWQFAIANQSDYMLAPHFSLGLDLVKQESGTYARMTAIEAHQQDTRMRGQDSLTGPRNVTFTYRLDNSSRDGASVYKSFKIESDSDGKTRVMCATEIGSRFVSTVYKNRGCRVKNATLLDTQNDVYLVDPTKIIEIEFTSTM